ncbi:MAG: hypothetical protein ACMXYL_05530 [Candidatus Woesearchaeota archaeon]
MFGIGLFQKKKETMDYLYIGSNSDYNNRDNIPDYYTALRKNNMRRFMRDYHNAKFIIVYCSDNINADTVFVRLQKPYDLRQMSIRELFEELELEEHIHSIFSYNTRKHRKGSHNGIGCFAPNGRQIMSVLLGKKIIFYERPKEIKNDYEPIVCLPS